MNYYKLISGKNFVGVITQHNFREYQHKHNILLACDEEKAQYVQLSDIYYRSDWMVPVTTDKISYETVEVIKIDKEEYDILFEAIENGDEIEVDPEQPEDIGEPPATDETEEITVEYVRSRKISEMSNACNNVITQGLDVVLSDGIKYHFSLTTQDQLNLITLSSMVASGETAIPYHADGELCRFYSAEDINTIIEAATAFKTFQVSYFNALKAYIESLTEISEIGAVVYGIEIPEEHQSDVLKVLLAQQRGGE